LCHGVLTSILGFTSHMRKEHKDSELERNKPFSCDICQQGFYFLSSLNSHRSKAHHEVTGDKFSCPLCSSVTNSKNGMRRHMNKSHGQVIGAYLCYNCEFCDSTFPSLTTKKLHVADHHKECVEVEKCFLCKHISLTKTALRRHFVRMHPGTPQLFENVSFKCARCDTLFPTKQLLTNHVREDHPKSVLFQCAYCSSQFTSKKTLATHVAAHKSNSDTQLTKPNKCDKCEKSFSSVRALKCHSVSVHSDPSLKARQRARRLTCKLCGMKFQNSAEKQVHQREMHKNNLYPCDECGASFSSKSGLYNHKTVHRTTVDCLYTCPTCTKVFNRRDTFKEHILIHTGPRHKCPHCPKDFVQRSNLKRHIRIHLGIKPYKCALCDSTFSDKGACNSHMKTHTGEEREACEKCGLVFSKKQKLKYHMRTHTGEGLKPCVICDKVFTHSYALNSHVKIHQRDKQFMCYVCKKANLSTKEDLFAHLETHGTGDFPCTICPSQFWFSKHLNRHIQAVHRGVQGFQCAAETCTFKTAFLARIRAHVQDSHSVKTPQCPTHFLDHFNNSWVLHNDAANPLEDDLYSIYECLDDIIDTQIMGALTDDIMVEQIKEEPLLTEVKLEEP